MKKGIIVLCLIIGITGVSLFAQSLEKNENYKKSVELADQSQKAFDDADYETATKLAIQSQEYAALARQQMAGNTPAPADGLAASYEVKLIPGRRDCLWRIAGYDFVYGNPVQWRRLYDANRDTFPQPDNPNLIEPGQILQIPSINGEARSGRR